MSEEEDVEAQSVDKCVCSVSSHQRLFRSPPVFASLHCFSLRQYSAAATTPNNTQVP